MQDASRKSNQAQKYKLLADTSKEDTNIILEMLIIKVVRISAAYKNTSQSQK